MMKIIITIKIKLKVRKLTQWLTTAKGVTPVK
jgi:hypothetical protein